MAGLLNLKLTLEDLLSPKVAAAIQKVTQLGQQVDKPHKLKVDASQANGALSGIIGLVGKLGLAAAFASGAHAMVGMGTQMEQTRIQFETFTGSAEKGNELIAKVQRLPRLPCPTMSRSSVRAASCWLSGKMPPRSIPSSPSSATSARPPARTSASW
jgi:hypothetical protein